MKEFDRRIKDQLHEELKEECLQVPSCLDKKIDKILDGLPNEIQYVEKKGYKKICRRGFIIAACLGILTCSTVFAATLPAVQQTIRKVIKYFDTSKDLTYTSEQQVIEKYAKGIQLSTKDQGIEMQIDDIAMDESYLYMFYTVKTDEAISYPVHTLLEEQDMLALWIEIDGGRVIEGDSYKESYLEDPYTLRGVMRMSVAQENIKDLTELTINIGRILGVEGEWKICSLIDKNIISTESEVIDIGIHYKINLEDKVHDITIDKVILSPLGNQLVISEDMRNYQAFKDFILFDDKGQVVEILNKGIYVQENGSVTNTFEFFGGGINMAYMTLVPVKKKPGLSSIPQLVHTDQLPVTVPTSELGNIVIKQIEVIDEYVKVQYEKEGIILDKVPLFECYTSELEAIPMINPVANPGGERIVSVDRSKGIYTAILELDKERGGTVEQLQDMNGLVIYVKKGIELLEDESIRINLK